MAIANLPTRGLMPQTWPGAPQCPPPPVCPACGGLECLCRPRFFAGQVLTEADLNRLEQYVVDKNKLHNRYLHGWGVVCGLEVGCHPCGDRVSVRSGYALSPCGDDIIVCKDDIAPICDLIRQCRPAAQPYPDCAPLPAGGGDDCEDLVEDWVLAICYDEKPARGITPLQTGPASGRRCSCGGSSSGGCGCGGGGKSGATKTNGVGKGWTTAARSTPPACEPTLTCEAYRFLVYKVPPSPTQGAGGVRSPLVLLVLECTLELLLGIPQGPQGANATSAQWQQWCCAMKQWLYDKLSAGSVGNCALFDLLANVKCPDASQITDPKAYVAALAPVQEVYVQIAGELLRACVCQKLLPPCPAPAECNCVPLAKLSVRRGDCKVLSVCNWGPRQHVLTFPDLGYWLGLMGIPQLISQRIERLCCEPLLDRVREYAFVRDGIRPDAVRPGDTAANRGLNTTPFAEILSRAWLRRDQDVNAGTLAMALLGATDAEGNPLLSSVEAANPAEFLIANQLVRPALEAALPPELSQLMATLAAQRLRGSDFAVPSAPSTPTASADDLAALRRSLDELRATVSAQAEEIARLRNS